MGEGHIQLVDWAKSTLLVAFGWTTSCTGMVGWSFLVVDLFGSLLSVE